MSDEINAEIQHEMFNASDVEAEVAATKAHLLDRRQALLFAARDPSANIDEVNVALVENKAQIDALG